MDTIHDPIPGETAHLLVEPLPFVPEGPQSKGERNEEPESRSRKRSRSSVQLRARSFDPRFGRRLHPRSSCDVSGGRGDQYRRLRPRFAAGGNAEAAPGSTITFDPSLGDAVVALTSGQLIIERDLTIDASALAAPVTVDAGDSTIFHRVLAVGADATVVLDSLNISGGETLEAAGSTPAENGGGIHNAGTLTIRNCTVSDNTTGYGGDYTFYGGVGGCGGGIYNSGNLVIENSTISHNTTGDGGIGFGAVYGWHYYSHSSYHYYDPDHPLSGYGGLGGFGAGVCNDGTLTIRNSIVSHNATGDGGAGLFGFEDDHAAYGVGTVGGTGGRGGGIHNAGTLTIEETTISENTTGHGAEGTGDAGAGGPGGGICQTAGVLIIERSTISGNTTGESLSFGGSGAGLIAYGGTLLLRNTTVSENVTGFGAFRGGCAAGLYNAGGTVTIESTTISGNATGEGLTYPGGIGGIYNSTGSLTIVNSIVAGNHAALGEPNLESWTATMSFVGKNLTEGDPMLAPLAFNGGPTRTMRPLPGSPAIDAGVPTGNTPDIDQRGLPRIAGAGLDLGAFESGHDTGYAAWAALNILPGLDSSFTGDANGDGLSNGLEYGTGPNSQLAFSLTPAGARISFGYRPEASEDLVWRLLRSTDLKNFTEVLRIEGGVPSHSPGDQLTGAPPVYHFLDTDPPQRAAFYRLEVKLIAP